MTRRSIGIAVAVVAAAIAVAALVARRAKRAPAPPPIVSAEDQRRICAALAVDYRKAWDAHNHCSADAACAAQIRGELFTGLDGCVRFGPRGPGAEAADAIAAEWLASGCASSFRFCPAPPSARCREGRCDELPPPPVPASWRRVDVHDVIELFVPADAQRFELPGEEGFGEMWNAKEVSVGIVWDPTDVKGGTRRLWRSEREVSVEEVNVSGQPAFLSVIDRPPGARPNLTEHMTSVSLRMVGSPMRSGTLSVSAHCRHAPPCPEGEILVRSVAIHPPRK